MPLTNLCDDVFQSMLDYLEYEEITRLSRVGAEVFVMCDDYVHRDVGASVADLYHFTDNCDSQADALPLLDCRTAVARPLQDCRTTVARSQKIEISSDIDPWVAPATIILY